MSKVVKKKVITEESRKRGWKIAIIVIASVLAALLIVGIVLGCIKTKGLSELDGYESVWVNGNAVPVISADNENTAAVNNRFKTGLKKSRYSLLRGIFEGVWSNSYKFELRDVSYREQNKKGDYVDKTRKEKVVVKAANIESYATTATTENEYALKFDFGRKDGEPSRTVKVEGEEIAFDTAIVRVAVSKGNIIEEYTVYFYDSEKIYGDGSEYYEINPVIMKADANNLFKGIGDIIEYYNGNIDNL